MPSLPGEEGAYQQLYSPLSTSSEKAEAAAKIAKINRIHAANAASDARWAARKEAQNAVH